MKSLTKEEGNICLKSIIKNDSVLNPEHEKMDDKKSVDSDLSKTNKGEEEYEEKEESQEKKLLREIINKPFNHSDVPIQRSVKTKEIKIWDDKSESNKREDVIIEKDEQMESEIDNIKQESDTDSEKKYKKDNIQDSIKDNVKDDINGNVKEEVREKNQKKI